MEEDHKHSSALTPSVPAKSVPKKINLSVKFIGRYVPPPKPKAARARKSTIKHTTTQGNIIEEDEELMDEILDDEEENFLDQNKFGAGNISEILNDDGNDLSGMASS